MTPLFPDEVEEQFLDQKMTLIGFTFDEILFRTESGDIFVAMLCPACDGHLAFGKATEADITPEKLGEA